MKVKRYLRDRRQDWIGKERRESQELTWKDTSKGTEATTKRKGTPEAHYEEQKRGKDRRRN